MAMIRMAQEVDVPRLAAVGIAAWEGAIIGLADAQNMRRVAELAFLSFVRSHWAQVCLVEVQGSIAGWAAREHGDMTISDLWIDPAVQRQGLGGLLLSQIETQVAAAGFDYIELKTHAENSQAIGFFRKHGYGVSALSTSYSAKLDRDVASVSLTKRLDDHIDEGHQAWF